jgi:hypothetical protein
MIDMNLRNGETQLSFKIVGFTAYLFSPLMFWLLLLNELDSGAIPPGQDSLGIPMFGFLMIWFIGLMLIPVITIFVVLSRRVLRNFRECKLQ